MKTLTVAVLIVAGLVGNAVASTWYVEVRGEWQRVDVVPTKDGLQRLNVMGPVIYVDDGMVFNRLSLAGGTVENYGDTGPFRCGDAQHIGVWAVTCK